MREELTPGRVKAARAIAVAADLLQIALLPAFFPGVLSPANNAIDVLVAVALVWLLGWHWALLPTLVAETVPLLDLVPTWTAAVFLATRGRAGDTAPPVTAIEATARPVAEPARLPPADQTRPRGPSGA